MYFIRGSEMKHWSMCSLLAPYSCLALSSLQKCCHYFIWTQLFPPLAPSVMTFLLQPEQRSHSPFSIVGWKLISSRGMSCHPLSLPSAVYSFSISTYLEVKILSWAFYFWTKAVPNSWFPCFWQCSMVSMLKRSFRLFWYITHLGNSAYFLVAIIASQFSAADSYDHL